MSDHQNNSGWTLSGYIAHNEALRVAEKELQAERDRRYTEGKTSDEKWRIELRALDARLERQKEDSNKVALDLARTIQTYKDEQGNQLREQINRERGLYASKEDVISAIKEVNATINPLMTYVATQQGRGSIENPQMEKLTALVTQLAMNQAAGGGEAKGAQHTKDEGRAVTNLIIGGVGVLLTVGMFFLAFRDSNEPQVLPNVTYKPDPTPAARPK